MLYFHEKTPDGFNARRVEEVLCCKKTQYQQVTIVKHDQLGKTLYLDDCFQADDAFQYDYHFRMAGLARANTGKVEHILICGSGPGGMTKVCLDEFPEAKIIAIELDREAYNLYQLYLDDWGPVYESKRVIQLFGDAFNLLGEESFDIVFWDIDADTIKSPFLTVDPLSFWRLELNKIKKFLNPHGAFVATSGYIQERGQSDPYEIFNKACMEVFNSGCFSELTRLNWKFFTGISI